MSEFIETTTPTTVRTPEQGGTTCAGVREIDCALATAKGVSGWRFKTPSGRTGDGLPSKVITIPAFFAEEQDSSSNDSIPHEPEPETLPYHVSPQYIHCESLNSSYYNKTKVDDLVFIGMCDLYEKVIPQMEMIDTNMQSTFCEDETPNVVSSGIAHMPYHTQISEQSYVYTSEYAHNKLDIMIMEQNPESVNRCRMYVRFTIVPKYEPTKESDTECDKIEKMVLDVIFKKVQDHFIHLKHEDWLRTQENDRHSNRGFSDLY